MFWKLYQKEIPSYIIEQCTANTCHSPIQNPNIDPTNKSNQIGHISFPNTFAPSPAPIVTPLLSDCRLLNTHRTCQTQHNISIEQRTIKATATFAKKNIITMHSYIYILQSLNTILEHTLDCKPKPHLHYKRSVSDRSIYMVAVVFMSPWCFACISWIDLRTLHKHSPPIFGQIFLSIKYRQDQPAAANNQTLFSHSERNYGRNVIQWAVDAAQNGPQTFNNLTIKLYI